MSILQLIASDSFITVNKTLIKLFGLEAAVLLGELAGEHNYWKQNEGLTEDGFFFSTIENVEDKTSLSEHKQRQALKKLEELGIVTVKIKGLPAKRYIKINKEQLTESLQTKETNLSETSSGKFQELEPENFKGNNNITKNNITNNINNEETSSSTPDKQPKKLSRKEQLTAYISSLSYREETKDILFKWLFSVGLPKGVKVEQLQDMLKKLWNECNSEDLVKEAVNSSYLNNWFGFFPPKASKPYTAPKTSQTPVAIKSNPIQIEAEPFDLSVLLIDDSDDDFYSDKSTIF